MLRKHFVCHQICKQFYTFNFNIWLSFFSDQRNHETSSSRQGNLKKPSYGTNMYGNYTVIARAVDRWNKLQK